MSDTSIFTDKDTKPTEADIRDALGKMYRSWQRIKEYAIKHGPGIEEWHYSRSGWNCRIKGKKSIIIYLMPCKGNYKTSFVLGAKATTDALGSNIPESIKKLIGEAKVYAEGRGIRIDITNEKMTGYLETLVDIKLSAK
jgi:hypothetical protein